MWLRAFFKLGKIMTKQHAKLSASGSSRWLNCPGSVKAEENYPKTTSKFAEEGTLAHGLAEVCLKKEIEPKQFIGGGLWGSPIDKEMAAYVQQYLDYVGSFETLNTQLYVETRVDFSNIAPDGFGTCDAFIIDPSTKICHIFDLKYGAGVVVSAEKNTQAMLYALGILNDFEMIEEIDEFAIHIVQPRTTPSNFDFWKISTKDLLEFGEFARKQSEIALSDNAPRVAGEKQCQWCAAKGDCEERANLITNVFKDAFDDFENLTDLDKCNQGSLTDDKRKLLLDNQDQIESILKDNRAAVQDRLERGGKFEGYKLVEGRSVRKWTDKAEAYLVRKLGKKNAFKMSLIGITEAEKLLSKEEVDKVAQKPKGKPILVPESDKRKPFEVDSIEEQFDDIEDL